MLLNTDKIKVMLLTIRQKRLCLQKGSLSLNYNDLDLKLTSNEKILGAHIEENSMWTASIYIKENVIFVVDCIAN